MKQIVLDLSDPYANFMRNPVPSGSLDVCQVCHTFTRGALKCHSCAGRAPQVADAVLPVTYSVHLGQMHDALRQYKRSGDSRTRVKLTRELSAVLYRFLEEHESCLAQQSTLNASRFDLVTSVPSSAIAGNPHPLEDMVGRIVPTTRDRYEGLLSRSAAAITKHSFSRDQFDATFALAGKSVLLVDDTWTTGCTAQAAAAALKEAGASEVGIVVIGRHVHDDFEANAERLKELPKSFDWHSCAFCSS